MATGDRTETIDRTLRAARESLDEGYFPLELFNDEEVHDLEMDRIFGESWVFIGHESEIPEPGDYARRYIGNDTFIFVRDESGEVNLLFDSCRHRGAQVCRAEQGNTSHFRCPYHGWTYKNDGEAAGIPQKSKAFKSLDRAEYGLAHVPRLESYEGLVFASLAEEGPSRRDRHRPRDVGHPDRRSDPPRRGDGRGRDPREGGVATKSHRVLYKLCLIAPTRCVSPRRTAPRRTSPSSAARTPRSAS